MCWVPPESGQGAAPPPSLDKVLTAMTTSLGLTPRWWAEGWEQGYLVGEITPSVPRAGWTVGTSGPEATEATS